MDGESIGTAYRGHALDVRNPTNILCAFEAVSACQWHAAAICFMFTKGVFLP